MSPLVPEPAPGSFDPQPPAAQLDWDPVIGCLPTLENDFDAGGWAPSREDPDGVIHVGYPELSADADRVLGALARAQVVVPFDWPAWMQARGAALVDDRDLLADADLEDCRRLLAALVRGDRFNEGLLLSSLENGLVTVIIRRVRDLVGAAAA